MKDGRRLVITIGRQFGSGGREIGSRLAEELGIGFYDKNILRMNSNESGIKESYYHLADERPGSRLLYKIIKGLTPELGLGELLLKLLLLFLLFLCRLLQIRQHVLALKAAEGGGTEEMIHRRYDSSICSAAPSRTVHFSRFPVYFITACRKIQSLSPPPLFPRFPWKFRQIH